MHASWKADHRRTLWVAVLGFTLWAFLIYWQGEITWLGFRQALSAVFTLNPKGIPAPYGSVFLDILLFVAAAVFWALLFAHFILPIQQPNELAKVLKEMATALLGKRPIALILKNGLPDNSNREGRKENPSILLLDSASAALLRNAKAYTRAVGPGLAFSKADESVAGTLDLRIQRRAFGPYPFEEPFAPKGQDEELVSYQNRQERRQQSSALTQEGVEIVPRIEVDFRVEGRPGEDGSPYPFQAEFVWRALANERIIPESSSDTQAQQISWDLLPVHLATELWREYLGKFKMHELFESMGEQENAPSGLEQIEDLINARLTKAIVPESFTAKEVSKRNTSSPEYQLLRSRGLRVLNVRLQELHLNPLRDETGLVNEWSEAWEMRAIQTSIKDSHRNEEKERSGQQAAAAEFLRLVSSPLFERLRKTDGRSVPPPDESESLELLLKGSLEGASRLPALDAKVRERLQFFAHLLNGGSNQQS